LRVMTDSEEFVVRIPADDDPRQLGSQDVVFVTVKAPSLPGIAARLPALLNADTTVVFAQNGIPWWYHAELGPSLPGGRSRLDPEGLLQAGVGLQRSVGCVLHTYDEVISPGVFRNLGTGPYVLGEPSGEASDRCSALSAVLASANLKAVVSTRIRTEIWNKLLLNVANGAICCLTGCTLREVARNPGLRALSLRLMHEVRAVAAAHGVPALGDPETMLPADMPRHKPSMLKDLERGRETEIDAIYGAVGDFARAADVPTPLLDAFTTLLWQRAEIAMEDPARLS
jgi:2-dehydropantoate 2-reductase